MARVTALLPASVLGLFPQLAQAAQPGLAPFETSSAAGRAPVSFGGGSGRIDGLQILDLSVTLTNHHSRAGIVAYSVRWKVDLGSGSRPVFYSSFDSLLGGADLGPGVATAIALQLK